MRHTPKQIACLATAPLLFASPERLAAAIERIEQRQARWTYRLLESRWAKQADRLAKEKLQRWLSESEVTK